MRSVICARDVHSQLGQGHCAGPIAGLIVGLLVVGCSGSDSNGTGPSGVGGSIQGTGGVTTANGGNVSTSTGGQTAFGGSVSQGGANPSVGGSVQTGGAQATGGALAQGGSSSTGGAPTRGGSSATGGNMATGGTNAAGGSTSTGGKASAGGSTSTGGTGVAGSTTSTGGAVAAGGKSTGGTANTGGAVATGGTAPTGGTSSVLGATPPMGWNSWNTFACNGLTEALVKGVADTFVSSGMKDAGYQYVNLDDCWMNGRDASGTVQVNATKFPSGMKSLADYIHGKGLKIGLYSTPGTKTCANIYSGYTGGVGSLNYETKDAQTYASWGIDYLKYDKCTAALGGFAVMRDALRATGRAIFYSINPGDGTGCVPGKCSINLPTIANMWRIGFDINASWSSMIGLADQNEPLYSYAGPGHWNDPDMLEVGKLANATEDRAHFSLWAIMAAPLIAGNDIRSMNTTTRDILTNAEVIAVDQDPLGVQGHVVAGKGTNSEVWAKKLSGTNTVAVVLLNRGTSAASITAQWSAIGITGAATVRDLWSKTDLGSFTGSYTASAVPGHAAVMLKIVGS